MENCITISMLASLPYFHFMYDINAKIKSLLLSATVSVALFLSSQAAVSRRKKECLKIWQWNDTNRTREKFFEADLMTKKNQCVTHERRRRKLGNDLASEWEVESRPIYLVTARNLWHISNEMSNREALRM